MKAVSDVKRLGFDPGRLARVSDHFKSYVDLGKLPGWQLVLSRQGQVVLSEHYGQCDMENAKPTKDDTLYRIFSMTKPVTSVAAMMLVEQGKLKLRDPVAKYIPAFADSRVYRSGSSLKPTTEGLSSPMQVWHLLTHTAGLSYGFMHAHPVDAMYRAAGYEWGWPEGQDLAGACSDWAAMPLMFQPGAEWNYSVATDVLGRVVEVCSGQSLDAFFAERIFEPLGMVDTAFYADEQRADRLAALYVADPENSGKPKRFDAMGDLFFARPSLLSGGGGLVSSASDYLKFVHMLLGEGALGDARLLGSRSLRYMRENHLPGGASLSSFGRPLFSETDFDGMGFGLGFSVVEDNREVKNLCSNGEYAWGGAASTAFWVDPQEQITAMFFTQLLPSSTLPIRPELRQLVYQALVD
ncbi:MAG: serine hydrolase domain-containing protein [Granulosicoccaceae bacterium]